MTVKPKALALGDTIALVAPSGRVASPERVDQAAAALDELGFAVRVYPSCRSGYGYLSGTDEERALDLNAAFADGSIDGIVCLKGGYGTPRILDRLDYPMIARHPKLFVGYSDITAIHIALRNRCGLATVHGPMPSSDMLPSFDPFSREAWLAALTRTDALGALPCPPGAAPPLALVGGRAKGELAGGNLSLIAATMGTPFQIEAKGRVLFLEDIDEAPYRIDRMLTQLRLSGVLDACAGIVLGNWNNCEAAPGKPGLSLAEVFRDTLCDLGKPVLAGLAAGHCHATLSLPLGCLAELDTESGAPGLAILEAAAR
jgi:muramoyltetrapeptide carboxypeptidase